MRQSAEPGPDTNHGETPPGLSGDASVDGFGASRDGAGGACGFAFRDDQFGVRAGQRQRRTLGHAMAADFAEDGVRRVCEARGLGLQFRRREKTRGQAEMFGTGQHGLFVGFQIQRCDRRDRP